MRTWLKGLGFGVFVAGAGVAASFAPVVIDAEQDVGLAWLFHLRGSIRPPDAVAIVAVDREAAHVLGVPATPRDWPRDLHARLIRSLAAAGARLIVFDLTFDSPARNPRHDAMLGAAIRDAGTVLLAESLRREATPVYDVSGRLVGTAVADTAVPPIDLLREGAVASAPFALPKSSRVDAFWTFISDGHPIPSLPGIALHVFAHDAYADLRALWSKAANEEAPAAGSGAVQSSQVHEQAIVAMRTRLLQQPSIATRLARLIDAQPWDATSSRQRAAHALLDYYAGPEVRYLNFYGPPRTITTIPYQAALAAGDATPGINQFAGKVVFVGFSAAAPSEQDRIRDDYHTVYSSPEGLYLSGVEIAATAFANLLEDRPLRVLPPAVQLTIVACWGLLIGVACRRLRPLRALSAALALAAAYAAGATAAFAALAIWLPVVVPMAVQPIIALLGGAALNHRDVRREREVIKRAFGYFLPNAVVDQLARQVGPMTATEQLVYGSCLATDAEQYTTLAEKMHPTDLTRFMNRYYARLFEPVARRGGIVSDVVGDAMVAIWASSSSDVTLRRQACVAACEMADAMESFSRSGEGPPLRTRIGLHSGQMLLGQVGAGHHYEYRAVGDIVNTASRMQALNKQLGTRVLVSEAAIEGLDDLLVRPLGAFVLAGKTASVRIFELLGIQAGNAAGHPEWTHFATALESYRAGRVEDAVRQFEHVLALAPTDGPARFYLTRCRLHAANPPDQPWNDAVVMDK